MLFSYEIQSRKVCCLLFYKHSLIIKSFYTPIIILFISSCSIKPAVVHDSSLYLGGFKSKKVAEENCFFSSVEGVGVKLSFLSLGLGYFNHKKLTVDIEEGICESDLATVKVMIEPSKIKMTNNN